MPSWEEDEDLTAQCELHSEPRPLCGMPGPLPSRGWSQSPGSDLLIAYPSAVLKRHNQLTVTSSIGHCLLSSCHHDPGSLLDAEPLTQRPPAPPHFFEDSAEGRLVQRPVAEFAAAPPVPKDRLPLAHTAVC